MSEKSRKRHSWYTPDKQETLNGILGKLVGVMSTARCRWMRPVLVDCTAGDGKASQGVNPSPSTIVKHAQTLSCPAYLIDMNLTHASLLCARQYPGDVRVIYGRWEDVLLQRVIPEMKRDQRNSGVFYFDHNGCFADGSYEVLAKVVDVAPRVDILINVTATGLKRFGQSTEDIREAIGKKKNVWVRRPRGSWQWTMMLATNCEESLDRRGWDMVHAGSPEGEEVCRRLDFVQGGEPEQQLFDDKLNQKECDVCQSNQN